MCVLNMYIRVFGLVILYYDYMIYNFSSAGYSR